MNSPRPEPGAEFLARSHRQIAAAAAVASPAITLVTWPLSDHGSMLTFLVLHELTVLMMALICCRPAPASIASQATTALIAVHGLLPMALFFDLEAGRRSDFVFGVGIVLFAFAASTVTALGPSRRLARLALTALFAPYAVGALMLGHRRIALGTAVFLLAIAGVAVARVGDLFDELITLRSRATERAEAAEAVATTDSLTGLTNRYGLTQLDGQYRNMEVAGIFIDLDRFKAVNDTLGHKAGDQVLVEVAKRIRRHVRPSDTVARLGGDEFFILLASNAEMPVMDIADRIREAVDLPIPVEGGIADVSASIGLSRQGPGELDLDALVETADEALYMAKSLGRNQVIASSVRLNETHAQT